MRSNGHLRTSFVFKFALFYLFGIFSLASGRALNTRSFIDQSEGSVESFADHYWIGLFKEVIVASQIPDYSQRSQRLFIAVNKLKATEWSNSPLRTKVSRQVFQDSQDEAVSLGDWYIGLSEAQMGHWVQAHKYYQEAYFMMLSNNGILKTFSQKMKNGRHSQEWVNTQRNALDFSVAYLNSIIRTEAWSEAKSVLTDVDERFSASANEKDFYKRHPDFRIQRAKYMSGKGLYLSRIGRLEQAKRVFESAYRDASEMADRITASFVSSNIGDVFRMQERWECARAFYFRSLFEEPPTVLPVPTDELSRWRNKIYSRIEIAERKLNLIPGHIMIPWQEQIIRCSHI